MHRSADVTLHGTIAFMVGTGGKPTGEIRPADTTAAAVFGKLGLLRMDLGDDEVHWIFIDAQDSAVLDARQAPCNERLG